ncbi:MAG: amino acid permease [Oscillospiraceae bacterium]|nr:amino acid permease [Oscillospiraceae bacterium]
MEKQTNEMKKNMGVMSAISIVVGCVIGAGVFFKPYAIYQATGGAPGLGLLSWVIGGLISIFGALTFAEIAVLIPRTGGMVTYLGEVYDRRIGFLAGWMQVVIFYPAYLAGYGVKVGTELSGLLGVNIAMPVALVIIAGVVALNTLGSGSASKFQIVSTVCKLIPLFLITVVGFILGRSSAPILTPVVGEGINAGSALGTALLAVLFAFEGWTNVGAIAGEMKNPARDLPRAIVGGVSIIMAVYLLINIAYIRVIPASELMHIESPAAAVATKLFGSAGGTIIAVGIIISVIGAGNGFLLSGSRVAYYLAEEGMLPFSEKLAKLNSKLVPANAIILVGTLAALYSLIGQFDLLTDMGTFSCWIFYTLTFFCVIRMRRTRPELERKYKVPGYPVIPALAIASGAFVVASQLFMSGSRGRIMALASVAITLVGLPVYLLVQKKKN